jgi:hypothetical protein
MGTTKLKEKRRRKGKQCFIGALIGWTRMERTKEENHPFKEGKLKSNPLQFSQVEAIHLNPNLNSTSQVSAIRSSLPHNGVLGFIRGAFVEKK